MVKAGRRSWCLAWLLVAIGLTGCEGWGRKELPPEPAPRPAVQDDPVLADTVGALTYLADVTGQPVRGFGIVVGLPNTGGSDCPTYIRDHLVETMLRERDTWASLELRRRFSPSQLIESPSTAVVEVAGSVPAGAVAGSRFDILVRAIPGTSTTDLTGGLLLPCELHLADVAVTDEQLLGSRVVARAAGPVFVNPFLEPGEDSIGEGTRRGYVLSGGQSLATRTLRLLLREPSYPMARRLERRINERFGQRPPVAEARSQGYLVLTTPREFRQREDEFIRLVTHVYVDGQPAFLERKLQELARLVVQPGARYEQFALIWEGVGRLAVPQIQPLYSHSDRRVRFYAARAGLRLGDVTALPVVAEAARSDDPGLALLAVRALGRCRYPQATLELTPLLDVADAGLRIAAYEALLGRPQGVIRTRRFPFVLDPMQLNFALDVIDCGGPPLIYVRRTKQPRIAVFGAQMPVNLPLFYASEDDTVTVTAVEETGDITILTRRGGKLWDPVVVPPRVADLIAGLATLPARPGSSGPHGLGLSYSQVIHVLSALCRDGTIPAPLEVERRPLTDLLGPEPLPERPEADTPPGPAGTNPAPEDTP